MSVLDDLNTKMVATVGASLGSANYGATELLGTNYAADLLGTNVGLAYIAVGAAGVVLLTDEFGVTEVLDE